MLRKKILLFMSIIACLILGTDKLLLAKNFQLGFKVGFNYSDFYGKSAEGWKPISGIQLGVFFNKNLNNYLSVQPEIIFSQKGSEIDVLSRYMQYHEKVRENYLGTSLLILFKIPVFKKNIVPSVYFGPKILYKLSSVTSRIISYMDPLIYMRFFEPNNKYDTGLLLGTNIYFPLFSKGLLVDIRYFFGIISIYEYGDIFNHAFSVSLGYNIFK